MAFLFMRTRQWVLVYVNKISIFHFLFPATSRCKQSVWVFKSGVSYERKNGSEFMKLFHLARDGKRKGL